MKLFKSTALILICLLMVLFAGCSNDSKTEAKIKNESSTINIEENKDTSQVEKEKTETQVNNTVNEVKKESSVKENKDTASLSSTEKKPQNTDTNKKEEKPSNTKAQEKNTFTLIVAKNMKGYFGEKSEVILKEELEVKGNTNAMTYLRDKCDVIDKGGLICSINGVSNLSPIPKSQMTEEQKKNGVIGIDWFIYLNDEKTSQGANAIIPVKGDKLLFDLHEWDKREFKGK